MQQPTPSPSQLFFDAWDHKTAHLPQLVAPSAAGRGPALQAADFAAELAARLMTRLLGWPEPSAHRLAMLFCLDVVIWASLDGAGREALQQRLSHTEAKFLAREQLEMPGWAVERGHLATSTPGFRTAELPPAFYLQVTERGETKRVLPWAGAERYVTDGRRYGVEMRDGGIRWFGTREDRLLEELREDFSGVDLLGIVEGLKDLLARETMLPVPLALDVARLEAVLQRA